MFKKFKVRRDPQVYEGDMANELDHIDLGDLLSIPIAPGRVKTFPLEIETKGCNCCAQYYLIEKDDYIKLLPHLKSEIEAELKSLGEK